MLATRCAA